MDKLTLEHLAPYLPYGLQMKGNGFTGKLLILNAVNGEFKVSCSDWWEDLKDNKYKPLLRPLSQLTEEIEHNGERFVPIDFFLGEDPDLIINALVHHKDYSYLPYNLIQILLKWHFDVFWLINKGLAIDINSLNEEQ